MATAPDTLVRRGGDPAAAPTFGPGDIDGHRARRPIGGGDVAESDPFLILAEDVMPHDVFARHPHRRPETVTVVLDSAGHVAIIGAGDAQGMTAGRSVIPNENGPIRLRRAHDPTPGRSAGPKMAAPRHRALPGPSLPVRRGPGAEIRVLSGRSEAIVSLNHPRRPS